MPTASAKTTLRPWPKWARLKVAVEYSGLPRKRLVALADAGEIEGYQDTDDRRGGSEGAWWIYLPSIDIFHDRRSGRLEIESAVQSISML